MNCMKAGLRMRFVSFVCVLLGVVLLVTGAGLRLLVENLDEVKVANETAEEHIGMRISPRAAGEMERMELSSAPHHAISENASLVWLAPTCAAVIE